LGSLAPQKEHNIAGLGPLHKKQAADYGAYSLGIQHGQPWHKTFGQGRSLVPAELGSTPAKPDAVGGRKGMNMVGKHQGKQRFTQGVDGKHGILLHPGFFKTLKKCFKPGSKAATQKMLLQEKRQPPPFLPQAHAKIIDDFRVKTL
jgi:hypothetical protein